MGSGLAPERRCAERCPRSHEPFGPAPRDRKLPYGCECGNLPTSYLPSKNPEADRTFSTLRNLFRKSGRFKISERGNACQVRREDSLKKAKCKASCAVPRS